jgi:hypothetical protein
LAANSAVLDFELQNRDWYLSGTTKPGVAHIDVPQGKILRLTLLVPAVVHWTLCAWVTSQDTNTRDTRLGAYIAELPTKEVLAGNRVCFTFYWPEADGWQGANFEVAVEPAGLQTKDVLATVDPMPVHLA